MIRDILGILSSLRETSHIHVPGGRQLLLERTQAVTQDVMLGGKRHDDAHQPIDGGIVEEHLFRP